MALLNFVSSAVNELTALVAIIPIVFALSIGAIGPVSLTAHKDEVLLTMAQSLYACVCLMDLKYDVRNALLLFGLWLVSTAFVETRFAISIIFLFASLVEVIIQRKRITVFSALKESLQQYFSRHS
jgi:hypothetical protein